MRRKILSLTLAALAASLAACGDDDDGVDLIPYSDDGKLTVMTRNLYLGADLNAVITAALGGNSAEVLAATTAAWNAVQANDPRARLAEVAEEIATHLPDVVGLQEVSLWRTQTPGDFASGNPAAATAVVYDYLQLLLAELSRRGLSYVAVIPEGATEPLALFDVEVPIATGQDIRLTDRQVILARAGVPLKAARGGVFANLLELTILGDALAVLRGWTAVTATIGTADVVVFNTHLEAFQAPPRVAQAGELAALLDAAAGRVVLVGDLNSLPTTEGHQAALDAGFADVWTALHPGEAGFTCCFAPDLSAPRTTRDLAERIDYVLVRGGAGQLAPESATIVGEADADRTVSGLRPSDHAGLVAVIAP